MIIGITGKKRAGKTTVANMLAEHYGFVVLSFAGPLKDAVKDIYGLSDRQVEGTGYDREKILPEFGVSVRTILQQMGVAARAISEDTWVRHMDRSITALPPDTDIVVPDMRFLNESAFLRSRGATLVRVDRPGVATSDTHISETEMSQIAVDHVIGNDGTVDDLRASLGALLGAP